MYDTDDDGHFDRQGHVQEASGIPGTPLPHVEPPTVTTAPSAVQGWARVVGKTTKGDYLLEFKREAHTSGKVMVTCSRDCLRELMANLFQTLA